jgi:HSP20 family protein
MTLVRWNPWREIDTLQNQINNLFEDTRLPSVLFDRGLSKVPAAEIQETENAIHLDRSERPRCASHRKCCLR